MTSFVHDSNTDSREATNSGKVSERGEKKAKKPVKG